MPSAKLKLAQQQIESISSQLQIALSLTPATCRYQHRLEWRIPPKVPDDV